MARTTPRSATKSGLSPRIWRLLDANANRAREGLRVIEDAMRFILDRPRQAKALRVVRHQLDVLTRDHYAERLRHRDSVGDSGRENGSHTYPTLGALVAANFKRAQEAVRVLEEYGRLLVPSSAKALQRLRFEIYRLEKQVVASLPRNRT